MGLSGSSCSWVHSSPSPFQSAQSSLSDKALSPTTTGTVWGILGTGHKCWGQQGKTVSPGQQTHCVVMGVSTDQCVPDMLALQRHHLIVTPQLAERSLQGLHCKPVCISKAQVTLGALALATRAWEGQDDWDLLGLVRRQCSSQHALQKFSTSSGNCSVVTKTWKSRATNKWEE